MSIKLVSQHPPKKWSLLNYYIYTTTIIAWNISHISHYLYSIILTSCLVIGFKTLIITHKIIIAIKQVRYFIKSPQKINVGILDLGIENKCGCRPRVQKFISTGPPLRSSWPYSSSKTKRSAWLIASFNHTAHNKHLISPSFQNYFHTDECMSSFRHIHT